MTATTTTTIQGVSVLSRQKKHGTDVFELGLSHAGIEVRRPGRPIQQLSWDRVSEWEIEERKGFVLLTLRGRGATTPLVVPGWSLDDLEVLMRDVTSDARNYEPEAPGPTVAATDVAGNGAGPSGTTAAAAATAAAVQPKAPPAPAPPPARPPAAAPAARTAPPKAAAPVVAPVVAPAVAPAARTAPAPRPTVAPAPRAKPPTPSRAERRQKRSRERRARQPLQVSWKMVVTVVMLGALAAAVTLVLLQSAGVISWSFLGPVA